MIKEKNRLGIYIAIFIGAVMVLSVVGFITTSEDKYSYGKQSFVKKQEQWSAKINGKEVFFYYLPQEVEQINVSPEIPDLITNSRMVYVTYPPNETGIEELATAQYSLGRALEEISIFAVNALTETDTGVQITCANATQYVPVILLQKDPENSINLNNNCIILKGNPLIASDRLKYAIYRIIR